MNEKKKKKFSKSTALGGIGKHLLIFLLIFIGLSFVFSNQGLGKDVEMRSIAQVAQSISAGEIASLTVRGEVVDIAYTDQTVATLRKERESSLTETLQSYGITTEQLLALNVSIDREKGWLVKSILPFIFPILLIILLLWFLLKQAKGVGMQAFQFGQSRAKFIDPNDKRKRVTFKDVAGSIEPKQELEEFVDFLKNPKRYFEVGAKLPKGVLLTGAPGTGKTLLAQAVAGEAGVPFFSISGSEFVEMFVGVGAARVRDLFNNAKKRAPAIIFIDEIDAVGRTRGSGVGGGHDEREQALNQILVEMDGFEPSSKVIVMAATNRPDVLDHALLRPGRFDRKIVVDTPDIKERLGILKIHAKGKKFLGDVDLEVVAKRTSGLSGADLRSVVNEAAISAVRNKRKELNQSDLLDSIEKVILGPERKSRVISDREKKVTAYHEAGHALLATVLPYADTVQKISIISRGDALGYVLSNPDIDRRIHTRKEFEDTITMALGGYVAEELIFGDISTGPSSDLNQVANIARNMVTKWGMSEKIGPLAFYKKTPSDGSDYSEKIESEIDAEVSKIVNTAYKKATMLLKKYRHVLDAIVNKLFEVETLERQEFEALISSHNIKIQNALGK